ncbi:MAG: FAD binding domain-containing protein [Alphaproteobacteria bacterium]|jgi:carbon-monoxide dehydrogenase medium subunit|nr:carbon monoxide dehydrogenase [Rhodospirillaceae bacterium]MDP6022034.1 FAD binding domain-containing protein [Alphaproteobacteria bacterium]MDP6254676.1 FAD binding domain-containing protein [Alphaproteobacteria bacterium]MDP7053277.1 FAD binding domain-containing protein [Alphaproteobacteria bacterium]MDP7228815.1 FAD binding domain-containing protein [Alphaproteobacteria bacterium]|tara:strand:- start:7243 stop:8067 length:825 start_codon:yes stop_codon:yes gene_type:complete
MKPAKFEYHAAGSPTDALALLDRLGKGGKIIAGGQSMGPMMNLRVARPEAVVDIAGAAELRAVMDEGDSVLIGACVTHGQIEDGDVSDPSQGMLPHVAGGIAYRAVRNRGTIGGSMVHADPAADWVTALIALGARIDILGPDGRRSVPAEDFILSAYTVSLADGELVTAIRLPRTSAQASWGYTKLSRKVGEFADAIGAVVIDPTKRFCRVVLGGLDGRPCLLHETAKAIAKGERGELPELIRKEIERRLPQAAPDRKQIYGVALNRAAASAIG